MTPLAPLIDKTKKKRFTKQYYFAWHNADYDSESVIITIVSKSGMKAETGQRKNKSKYHSNTGKGWVQVKKIIKMQVVLFHCIYNKYIATYIVYLTVEPSSPLLLTYIVHTCSPTRATTAVFITCR